MTDFRIDPDARPGFRRVLLKLGGEMFGGGAVGVDPDVVETVARQPFQPIEQQRAGDRIEFHRYGEQQALARHFVFLKLRLQPFEPHALVGRAAIEHDHARRRLKQGIIAVRGAEKAPAEQR